MKQKIDRNVAFFVLRNIIKSLPTITGKPSALPAEPPKPYKHLGCWKDTGNRALPTLEGKDPIRLTGSYTSRKEAIQRCYEAAIARRYVVFGVQHGGWCAGTSTPGDSYKKYGVATNCANGKGGSWSNDVYEIMSMFYHAILTL